MLNFDQIRERNPITSLSGSETFIVNANGITAGGFLSVLREWITSSIQVDLSNFTEISQIGKLLITASNKESARDYIDAQEKLTAATKAEAEGGTSTQIRGWASARIRDNVKSYVDPLIEDIKNNPGTGSGSSGAGREQLVQVNTTATISATNVNRIIMANAATAITLTLPSTATPGGTRDFFQFINVGSAPVTISSRPDSMIIKGNTDKSSSFSLDVNRSATVYVLGNDSWFLEG